MIDTTIICEHTEFNQDCTPCRAKELMAESNCKDCTCGCCVWPFGEVVESCQCAPCVKHRESKSQIEQAEAEFQKRKQAEREAMDTRQAAHLSKIHRNDQLDAANRASKRSVKRQEIHDKQRHSAQENRRMDRVDARYVDSEPSAVDVENPFESLRVHLTGEVDLTPTPSLLETESGNPLIYSGKVTGVYSEPSIGKSFLMVRLIEETILKGGRALVLDYEDRAKTIEERAKTVGLDFDTYGPDVAYFNEGLIESARGVDTSIAWLEDSPNPENNVVIIDTATATGCPADGADVLPWYARFVHPWRNKGWAVVILDHVPKRRKDRPRGPIGSFNKLAQITGAALLIDGTPWTKKQSGRVFVYNEKDRPSDLAAGMGHCVAAIDGTWATIDGQRAFHLRILDGDCAQDSGTESPINRKVLEVLADAGKEGIKTIPALRSAVGGKATNVDSAAISLVRLGMVALDKVGNANRYSITATGMELLELDLTHG